MEYLKITRLCLWAKFAWAMGRGLNGRLNRDRRVLPCIAVACLALLWSSPAQAAPTVEGESVLNVAGESATLQAQVDPGGADTKYRFEYDTTEYSSPTPHGQPIPSPDGDIGSGPSAVTVEAHPQGLAPDTVYHFRLVAEGGGKTEGKDVSFTTQRAGQSFALPDGREYELVSPPDKQGADIPPFEAHSPVIQAAVNGGSITYSATNALGSTPAGNRSPEYDQILATRHPGGWSSEDLAIANNTTRNPGSGSDAEYRLFSPDLALGLVEPRTETALSAEATEGTPYLRNNECGGGGRQHCEEIHQSLYVPLVTPANVYPPGTKFGFEEENPGIKYISASPDLTRVVFISRAPLTSETGSGNTRNLLYEWAEGRLRLVSQMPNPVSEPLEGTPGLGTFNASVRHAISDDGSHVVWEIESGAVTHLYVRDLANSETVRIDAAQGVAEPKEGGGKARFQLASSDGSRVFFTDEQVLTANATAKPESNEHDLYEFDVANGKLTDLTVDHNSGESADVQGTVIGSSEDGSYLYFVANGILAPGVTRGHNLYMLRYNGETREWEEPVFIAKLSSEDSPDWEAGEGSIHYELGLLASRVSPNGRYLAFMSNQSLTGYDNSDASSGAADEEVYLYDAQTRRLVCASCNPTGARPVGVFDSEAIDHELFVDEIRVWGQRWLAASIPGWDGNNSQGTVAQYQPRYLANNGRLFFNSSDALVPSDTNGLEDVYEYEPVGIPGPGGVSGCTGSSVTFSEKTGGCVALISSGTSREESAFLDASESGDDVFFLTAARLVPQDTDTAYDIYDAHVCGAEGVPCSLEPVPPPPCTTSESCKASATLQPEIFGAPASATFVGTGNLTPIVSEKPARAKKRLKARKIKKTQRKRVKKATASHATGRGQ
jgi:hypothetical protein